MTARTDRMIRDAGRPAALEGTALAGQFRYWSGGSGRRYLTRALPIEAAAEFAGAPVVLAAGDGDGRLEAVWIGLAGEPGFDDAVAAARAVGASEAYVHLLSGDAADAREAVRDLKRAADVRGTSACGGPVSRRGEGRLAA